jgi:hypothetical protein
MSSNVLTQTNAAPRSVKLWPLATLPLSGVVAWAVNTGGEAIRWVLLGGVTWALAIPMLVSLEAGLVALMLFEPLRGLLRRAQYLLVPYTQSDPIHIVTPLITFLGFVLLLQRQRLGIFTRTPLAKLVSLLSLIYVLQIFNPLQGGLSIGLTGALFILTPVAWFYFGQAVKPEFLPRALRLMAVLGVLTSLYGIYHLANGFPAFEQYWLDNTDAYDSISLGHIKRALATFSSAEEWGRYLEVGALVAFGFGASAVRYGKRAAWFLCGAALVGMLLLTGQRTALFGLVLGMIVLFAIGARNFRSGVLRVLLMMVPVLLIVIVAKAPDNDDMLSHGEDERFQAVLSHSTRGALRPTDEGSLQERINTWTQMATETIPNHPLGMGLGATTIAVKRYEGGTELPPIDSYFISSVITAGLPAALLFIWILLRATFVSWRECRNAPAGSAEMRIWRVVAGVMPALILNSIFGNTFTLYSVAPIAWLMVGWIGAQEKSVGVALRGHPLHEEATANG